MKFEFNLTTVLALVVGLATLVAGYAQGFLAQHPDVMAVVLAVQQIIAAFLPPLRTARE
jgi:hypothetical protein